ncbi:MAG: class II fructose-bisphosphate aldolase [Clostridium sp.]|nr:class II fructose-bisphosphate aldolase [Clostridium sp.]
MTKVPMNHILESALRHRYAAGAFNVHTPHEAAAVIRVHEMFRAPAIIQLIQPSAGFMSGREDFADATPTQMRQGISRFCRLVLPMMERASVPVALNLDHGSDPDLACACADSGFTAVMIDGSHLSFEENAALTRQVSDYAHQRGVSVEAELGVLAGREDHTGQNHEIYTDPSRVCEFFEKSGADCLALSYGTLHGPAKGGSLKIRKEIAIAAYENMRFRGQIHPLVSHGSSLVRPDIVAEINARGGILKNASGVPLSQLLEVIPYGIAKINIGTDIRLSILRSLREYFDVNPKARCTKASARVWERLCLRPDCIDERWILAPIRSELIEYQDTEESRPLTALVERAVSETAGELLVHFGQAGMAGTVEL